MIRLLIYNAVGSNQNKNFTNQQPRFTFMISKHQDKILNIL